MPLYEFACQACEQKFERILPFDAVEAGVDCPTCGGARARRLISTFASLSRGNDGQSLPMMGGGCACSSGGCGCHN